jgi:hypothetical protein
MGGPHRQQVANRIVADIDLVPRKGLLVDVARTGHFATALCRAYLSTAGCGRRRHVSDRSRPQALVAGRTQLE